MPKRTTQNNKRKRAKTHGFRSRTTGTVLTSRRRKGRVSLAA